MFTKHDPNGIVITTLEVGRGTMVYAAGFCDQDQECAADIITGIASFNLERKVILSMLDLPADCLLRRYALLRIHGVSLG